MSTVPPIFSMFVFTTSMPTPRPETLVTFSAVEKPGRKIRSQHLAVAHARAPARRVTRPRSHGLRADALGVDAAAVVGDLDVDLAALVEGAQEERAPRPACRRRRARSGRLDAVVDGVADDVRERVLDRLDDRLVELGLACRPSRGAPACRRSAARSRTTRGNLLQTLPIGCMRVFMTPSCSSVVIRFRRCEVPTKRGVRLRAR